MVSKSLKSIGDRIERDLEQGVGDNDYIKDENAERLKDACKDLERCGVRCYALEEKIAGLAWFVGGDPDKIRKLQQKLNELGVGDRLLEDGVYGKKTLAAWEMYIKTLATGSLPVAGVINPLQSNLTGISHKVISGRKPTGSIANYYHIDGIPSPNQYSIFLQKTNDGMKPLFRLDHPHYEDGKPLPYHMNVDMDVPEFAKQYFYNHKEISESTYLRLKDFKNASKYVRFAGKVLLVSGIALDALELGTALWGEYKNVDRKLGKSTVSTMASIGTAILPGVGTAIGGAVGGVVLAIAGSFAGDKLGNYVVDITMVE